VSLDGLSCSFFRSSFIACFASVRISSASNDLSTEHVRNIENALRPINKTISTAMTDMKTTVAFRSDLKIESVTNFNESILSYLKFAANSSRLQQV